MSSVFRLLRVCVCAQREPGRHQRTQSGQTQTTKRERRSTTRRNDKLISLDNRHRQYRGSSLSAR